MTRGAVLFLIGLMSVIISLSFSLTLVLDWVFYSLGYPQGSSVTLSSFIIAFFWIGFVCVIIGIIGGILVGRNWQAIKDYFA